MTTKYIKSIEKLHKEFLNHSSSVIFVRRDLDMLYITDGYTFKKFFSKYKFIPKYNNNLIDKYNTKYLIHGFKISDDLEINIRLKNKDIFFETYDFDLINIE